MNSRVPLLREIAGMKIYDTCPPVENKLNELPTNNRHGYKRLSYPPKSLLDPVYEGFRIVDPVVWTKKIKI